MSDHPLFPDVPLSVIGPPEILARAEAEASRLSNLKHWKPAFERSMPETPLLVRRLDQTDRYYYIVSFVSGVGITARLRMHAHTGRFAEGVGVDKLTDALMPYFTPEEVRRRLPRLLAAKAETDRAKARSKKTKKKDEPAPLSFGIEPFLVWKPCAQSLSAFLPLYRIRQSGHSGWYFRVDGKLYDELTFGAGL